MDKYEIVKILEEYVAYGDLDGTDYTQKDFIEALKTIMNDYNKIYHIKERYKICKNCGKSFIAKTRKDTYYCDKPSPQDPTKTCKQYGAKKALVDRTKDKDDWYFLYRRTYQLIKSRVIRNPERYDSKTFEDFRIITKQWIEDIKVGKKTKTEFINWLKDYRESIKSKKSLKYL